MSNPPLVDMMDRSKDIKSIVNALKAVSRTEDNVIMSLNGSWGCGKTFVLNRVEEELRQIRNDQGEVQFLVLHYNCWQFDYYDEPLTAIVAAMQDQIQKALEYWPEDQKETVKKILVAGLWAFRSILYGLVRSAFKIEADFEEKLTNIIKDGAEAFKDTKDYYDERTDYDQLNSFKQAIDSTKETLHELCKKFTVVVIVDELDRCLPNYAIKVLERLHHLFDGPSNCAVVLAVDKDQLDQTICGIFGPDTKPDHYLQKFIHCSYHLETTNLSGSFADKYEKYYSLFDQPADNELAGEMGDFLSALFHGVDMRTQERLINKARLLHNMCVTEKMPYEMIAFELTLVRFAACEKEDPSISELLRKMPFVVTNNRIDVIYRDLSYFSNFLQYKWGEPDVQSGTPRNRWILNQNIQSRLAKPLIDWWWQLTNGLCNEGNWVVDNAVRVEATKLERIADCLRTHW